ncbi:hypothetical protein G7Y79_00012g031690 [Physcia stellaris]|nr:hypothetical protein G7Y79_00012g031690 [Physcia stellaris]
MMGPGFNLEGTPHTKIEKPEPRPSSVEQKMDNAKPFEDCTITLAVDVSGSTAGKVLSVEKSAITTICSQLTHDAKNDAQIVPWSGAVYPTLKLEEVHRLVPKDMTDPSHLCRSASSITALRKSSLWFLMTDGQVTVPVIQKFANAVPNIQLHGTACVVIIFGSRPAMPKDVNISVGYSVFAVAPHCMILFHDIDTEEVYALRAKGCFESLLPSDQDTPASSNTTRINTEDATGNLTDTKFKVQPERKEITQMDMDTKWADVARITYRNLARLHIPNPIPLSTDHIALSDGSSISIDDVLNNNLPEPVSARLFSNERDLTSILTTAGSRGLGDRADRWLTRSNDAAAAAGDQRRLGSIGMGRHLMRESRGTGMASMSGLSARYTPPERPANLSTASTLVGYSERVNLSLNSALESDEDL